MSIVYPLPFPAAPFLRTVKLSAQDLVGEVIGEFDGSSQVQQWPGQWWELEGSWPPMTRAQGETIVSFLASLHGKAGTFTWGDPTGQIAQGSTPGAPVVSGAVAQRSQTLATAGWAPSQQGILMPGDYIQPMPTSGNVPRLYKNLTVANSDGAGNAVLDIFPSVREALAAGTQIVTRNCVGTFRLVDNLRTWDIDVTLAYGLTLKAKEAI